MRSIVLLSFVVACAQPPQAENPKLTSAPVGWPTLGHDEDRFIRIDLGPDTLSTCRMVSPKFPFDSRATYAQDREQLTAFAACMNAPGMRDRTLLLVGRADPRGTDAYNEKLGLRRAEEIRRILVESGIAESRIDVASEGEAGAKGEDPAYSFGFDRRVDVVVRGGTHVP